MAQRIVTVFDCSKCGKTGIPEEEVSTYEVIAERDAAGLQSSRVKLDLCSVCRGEFLIFAHYGEPLTSKGARMTRTQLPTAGRAEMLPQRRQRQGRFSEPAPQVPPPAPVAEEMPISETNGRPLRSNYEKDAFGNFKCPDCSFTNHRPQGVGAHRAQVHGWRKAS